mmetsp:Transcript_17827/g.30995  ORF Transcript_17827/g.30995 Transcript_17827/m.30995 type:complete len:340 (-) Transcript_17827:311-1330(-)
MHITAGQHQVAVAGLRPVVQHVQHLNLLALLALVAPHALKIICFLCNLLSDPLAKEDDGDLRAPNHHFHIAEEASGRKRPGQILPLPGSEVWAGVAVDVLEHLSPTTICQHDAILPHLVNDVVLTRQGPQMGGVAKIDVIMEHALIFHSCPAAAFCNQVHRTSVIHLFRFVTQIITNFVVIVLHDVGDVRQSNPSLWPTPGPPVLCAVHFNDFGPLVFPQVWGCLVQQLFGLQEGAILEGHILGNLALLRSLIVVVGVNLISKVKAHIDFTMINHCHHSCPHIVVSRHVQLGPAELVASSDTEVEAMGQSRINWKGLEATAAMLNAWDKNLVHGFWQQV